MKTPRPESERRTAARLTEQLGMNITRATIRHLKSKAIDLSDPAVVMHALRQQERKPSPIGCATATKTTPKTSPPNATAAPLSDAELDRKLSDLQSQLLIAADYESARTIRAQIAGVRELFKTQIERGFFVSRYKVETEGLAVGLLVRQMFLKIPAELPQAIIGLEYPAAVAKCQDYAYQALSEVHELAKAQSSKAITEKLSSP